MQLILQHLQTYLTIKEGDAEVCSFPVEERDYEAEMEPVLDKYTARHELFSVKSVNMGSMFKLTYNVTMRDPSQQRSLMDAVRVRNGNLEVALMREDTENRGGL